MIKQWLFAAILLAAAPLAAQETAAPESAARDLSRLPLGDTLLSLPSSHIPWQGAWETKFTHRFNQSLDDGGLSDQLHSLFGLDSNADVVFGGAYAPRRDLQYSLMRSNTNDTLELAAKYVVLEQSATLPLTLTLRGGIDYRTERDLVDRDTFFGQAIVSRQFGRRAELFVMPTFATNAGRAVSGDASAALFDHAFNVPVAVAVMIRPTLSVVAELVPPNGDLPDTMSADLGWSVGIKRAIGAHWFEILVTNSQSTMVDQYVTTTFQGAPLDAGDVHLGFNIERRFGRRRR